MDAMLSAKHVYRVRLSSIATPVRAVLNLHNIFFLTDYSFFGLYKHNLKCKFDHSRCLVYLLRRTVLSSSCIANYGFSAHVTS